MRVLIRDQTAERAEQRTRSRRRLLTIGAVGGVTFALAAAYLTPRRLHPMDAYFQSVDGAVTRSLRSFLDLYPSKHIDVSGTPWRYTSIGQGPDAVVFLHGLGGDEGIWWQQLREVRGVARGIAVTYPAVSTLDGLATGVLAVLDEEGIESAHFVGSSLGGYLAQYLAATHPERIRSLVLGNTFPPNDEIASQNRTLGTLGPLLPERIVLGRVEKAIDAELYPASGNSELVRAYLRQQAGRMSKRDLVARYRALTQPFEIPNLAQAGIPVLIIEADNDPSVSPALRQALREAYPSAAVVTLSGVGHLPYLNRPAQYMETLRGFIPLAWDESDVDPGAEESAESADSARVSDGSRLPPRRVPSGPQGLDGLS